MSNATTQVTTAAGAQGISGSTSILLMWALNAAFGWTFPPEVSIAFSSVLGGLLHLACAKLGGCDTDGDGIPDAGVTQQTKTTLTNTTTTTP